MLVLIAGITGSLGQRMAKIALTRGLSVRGLGRNPDSLASGLLGQLESFVKSETYYDIPALEKAVTGVDAVINAYAPTPVLDLDGHLLLLRAAERAQIKVFIASSWSRDWTNIKFGDFEHYNNHIAFEHQAATTSSIRPVYIFTGLFSDLLFTQYGPGGFDTTGEQPRMRYWGDGQTDKWPWSTQDDAAEWTIDILLYGEGLQAGKGGFFKISSGVTTIEGLAAVYDKVFETRIQLTREGSIEDLEAKLARLRRENRTGYFEFMSEAAAVIASKGLWENKDVTVLDQFRKPTSLLESLRRSKT
jgi:nucleoside-diphosphate-sugar epimerase